MRPIPLCVLAVNCITTLDPMSHWERAQAVRSLLRPSEHLLLLLEGSFPRHGSESDSEASPATLVGDTSLGSSEETHVILAVVVHVDHAIGESGRLIINAFAPPPCAKPPSEVCSSTQKSTQHQRPSMVTLSFSNIHSQFTGISLLKFPNSLVPRRMY